MQTISRGSLLIDGGHAQETTPLVFATCFYVVNEDQRKLSIYIRNMFTSFRSLSRTYASSRFIIFTNSSALERAFTKLGADTASIEFVEVANGSFEKGNISNGFPGCLFLLDCIEWLSTSTLDITQRVLFVDPDVVANNPRPTTSNLYNLDPHKIHFVQIDYPSTQRVNGISCAELAGLIESTRPVNRYVGGEFLCITRVQAGVLSPLLRRYASQLEQTFGAYTEEHVLTLALSQLDSVAPANRYVCRVWNTFSHNNLATLPGLEDCALLHLPAEKRFGLLLAYELEVRGMWKALSYTRAVFSLYRSRTACRLSHFCVAVIISALHRGRSSGLRPSQISSIT